MKLAPQVIDGVVQELTRQSNKLVRAGYPPVVVCTPAIRPLLRQITSSKLPKLVVLSLNEITRDTHVVPQGQVPIHAIKLPPKRESDEMLRVPLMAAVA